MGFTLLILVLFALSMFALQAGHAGLGGRHRAVAHGRPNPGGGEARSDAGHGFGHVLVMVLVCLLPLFLLFGLGAAGFVLAPGLLWLVLIACGVAMFYVMGRGTRSEDAGQEVAQSAVRWQRAEALLAQAPKLADLFDVQGHEVQQGSMVLYGRLRVDSDRAAADLRARFAGTEVTPLLQEDDSGRPVIILAASVPRPESPESSRPLLHLGLLAATLVTTTWAGAAHQGIDLLQTPGRWTAGLPYAAGLMLILGVHELGHYLAARAHGMRVTLPYFIPVPFALGTFGAFIQMKSVPGDRRALFDVGVAGPLAGLAVAVPALLIGLQKSTLIMEAAQVAGGTSLGSSVLLAALAKLAFGPLASEGHRVLLHPLAFAGWLGLMLTALNLLPVGQLDGGHISHALLGRRRADALGTVALFGLVLLGLFVWSGLLTWALIVYFLAGTRTLPPLNDVSGVGWRRTAVGLFAFTALVLILTPLPHALYQEMGLHCPYL